MEFENRDDGLLVPSRRRFLIGAGAALATGALPRDAFASRAGWSASNVLRCSSAVLTSTPVTMAAWAYPTTLGDNRRIVSILNSASPNNQNQWALGIGPSDNVSATTGDGSSSSSSASTMSITANTWVHAAAVFASATSRAAYLNGGNKGTNTVSRTPTGLNRTSIGAQDNADLATAPKNMIGPLAHVAIWNVALADADIAALATGMSPLLMQPEALVAYWPLIGVNSPENNLLSNTATMSIVGSLSQDTNPPMFLSG